MPDQVAKVSKVVLPDVSKKKAHRQKSPTTLHFECWSASLIFGTQPGVATAPAPLLHTQQMAVELPPTRTVLSAGTRGCLWCN